MAGGSHGDSDDTSSYVRMRAASAPFLMDSVSTMSQTVDRQASTSKTGPFFLRHAPDASVSPQVNASYDGSNVVFRMLRMETWGPALMNLGYYPFHGPLATLNVVVNLELAQRALVMKSLSLLDIQPRHEVLDVACGRGKSSFIMHCLTPTAQIVGMDLLPHNISVAQTLFDQLPNLTYVPGDACNIPFPNESFDRLHCLEAAFHFPDRAQFLREANRVLRPGSRMVVVDFAWRTAADRDRRDDPETLLVRDVWQWEDFYTIAEYEEQALAAGFAVVGRQDWTARVATPIQAVFRFLSSLGNHPWGRRFLEWRNPLYRSISHADWEAIATAVRAHQHVRNLSRYMAYVLEKPC
jgi:MPBQ/MSBQ methyltransferase